MSQKKVQLLNPLSGNINVTGVITASSFVGSGEGLTGVASTDNIQTSTPVTVLSDVTITGVTTVGVVTGAASISAGVYYGDGSALTGIDASTLKSGSDTKAQAVSTGVNITGNLVATGNVSLGGTLTYQDVTNMDVLGIGTFQQGIQVLANGLDVTGVSTFSGDIKTDGSNIVLGLSGGATDDRIKFSNSEIYQDTLGFRIIGNTGGISLRANGTNAWSNAAGNEDYIVASQNGSVDLYYDNSKKLETTAHGAVVTGVATATTFSGELVGAAVTTSSTGLQASDVDLAGLLREQVTVTAGKLSDNTNINLQNGMVHLFTTAESTTSTPNLRYNGSTSLNSKMAIGEAISVTLITTAAAAGYSAQLTIDGNTVAENWIGGSAPDAGGDSGVDIYAYTIIKTADADFTVIGSLSKTSA